MEMDDLRPILDAFVESDKQTLMAVFILVLLLYHRGVLSREDLEALKGTSEAAAPPPDQRPSSLVYNPLDNFAEMIALFLSPTKADDNASIRSILTLIKGGKDDEPPNSQPT